MAEYKVSTDYTNPVGVIETVSGTAPTLVAARTELEKRAALTCGVQLSGSVYETSPLATIPDLVDPADVEAQKLQISLRNATIKRTRSIILSNISVPAVATTVGSLNPTLSTLETIATSYYDTVDQNGYTVKEAHWVKPTKQGINNGMR
jgi:hypothetical protein